MEFILQDSYHEEHDSTWAVNSQHYNSFVCLGCIVEILEDSERLCLQKKPAISELLRLLTYQSGDLLPLFQQEEQVVWHLAEILIDSFKETDDSFLSSAIDTCLKLVQQIGSEDLVMFFFDAIHQKVLSQASHDDLLPHYTLLGKMLYQLPGLSTKLVNDCDQLLYQISLDLSSPSEPIQSAVAYFFVFLTGDLDIKAMSPRLKQQLYHGILKMLSTVQTQAVQVNGIGLLINLLHYEEDCHNMMSLNIAGTTLVSAIKKLLLSKKEALLIGVTKCLGLLLKKEAGDHYGVTILESDLAEFLFEALHTQNVTQMESTLKTLHQLARIEHFYKRCHAVYGIESVLLSLNTAHELKNPQLLKLGYTLLAELLHRQPQDIPLFTSVSVVKKCLSLVEKGVQHHQTNISWLSVKAAASALRKEHLTLPVPFMELTSILKVVSVKAWSELSDLCQHQIKAKKQALPGEFESWEEQLQIYTSLVLSSARLCIQCKADPAACESTFTAPSSGGDNTVPPLQTFTETVCQIIDEIAIPLMMIHWYNIEDVTIHKHRFDLLTILPDLDQSVSDDIINKLVETGFLSSVLELKDKFRTDAALVEKLNQFLSHTLKCALSKEAGSEPSAVDLDSIQDFVKDMTFDLSKFRQAVSDGSLHKRTLELYIAVLYLCYRNDNRPLQNEDLQWVLSAIVEHCTTLEQLSIEARKHYIFLLAWSTVKGGMNMRSTIPKGLETLPKHLNIEGETWYTHDIVMLLWCFSDVVLATMTGPFVMKAYLENCEAEELENLLDVDKPECNRELVGLCSDANFRQSTLEVMARGLPELVEKAAILAKHCLCGLYSGAMFPPDPVDKNDEEMVAIAESSQKDVENLGKFCGRVNAMVLKIFLGNVKDALDHNLIALMQFLIKIQKMFETLQLVNVQVLHHVLKKFGEKNVSGEMRSTCLEVVAVALSRSKDNQSKSPKKVSAMVIQNKPLLLDVEQHMKQQCELLPISCDIVASLISSNITEAPHKISINLPSLINHMLDIKAEKSMVSLFERCFQAKLASPVVKLTGRMTHTVYRTLFIFLQQFIVQGISEVMMASVRCMEVLINFLLEKDNKLVTDLLGQPWNDLMLDILVELGQFGLGEPTVALFDLFLDHDAGIAVITSQKKLIKKLCQCFKKDFYKSDLSADVSSVKTLALKVLEKLNSKLTKSEKAALTAFTK